MGIILQWAIQLDVLKIKVRGSRLSFRNRIGIDGVNKLQKLSISLFEKKEVEEKEVLIDTTVQEKNITFPTDTKLHKKIIKAAGRQLREKA